MKKEREEIKKIISILAKLDKTSLMLIDSNATVLKARQDLEVADSYKKGE